MSKILIVEDEESIAELEKDYLELSGFEVEIENNGTDGLDRALKEPKRIRAERVLLLHWRELRQYLPHECPHARALPALEGA